MVDLSIVFCMFTRGHQLWLVGQSPQHSFPDVPSELSTSRLQIKGFSSATHGDDYGYSTPCNI